MSKAWSGILCCAIPAPRTDILPTNQRSLSRIKRANTRAANSLSRRSCRCATHNHCHDSTRPPHQQRRNPHPPCPKRVSHGWGIRTSITRSSLTTLVAKATLIRAKRHHDGGARGTSLVRQLLVHSNLLYRLCSCRQRTTRADPFAVPALVFGLRRGKGTRRSPFTPTTQRRRRSPRDRPPITDVVVTKLKLFVSGLARILVVGLRNNAQKDSEAPNYGRGEWPHKWWRAHKCEGARGARCPHVPRRWTGSQVARLMVLMGSSAAPATHRRPRTAPRSEGQWRTGEREQPRGSSRVQKKKRKPCMNKGSACQAKR